METWIRVGFIINCMLACRYKRSRGSSDLIMSCLDTSNYKHAESVASLTIHHVAVEMAPRSHGCLAAPVMSCSRA